MVILRRIGVISFAKIYGIIMALFGLVAGIFIATIGSTLSAMGGSSTGLIAGLGFFAIIVLPIFYGVLGFIGGIVMAFLYNVVAGWVGGVNLDFFQPVQQEMAHPDQMTHQGQY